MKKTAELISEFISETIHPDANINERICAYLGALSAEMDDLKEDNSLLRKRIAFLENKIDQ